MNRGACRALAEASGSGRCVDPEPAKLAVERRPADAEAPRDLAHSAAIMADGETDDVRFDFLERSQMTIGGVEFDARRSRNDLVAARLAERRRAVGSATGEARLHRDMREVLGGERVAVALQRRAEQHAGKLANVAGPAVAHEDREGVIADRERLHAR